MKLLFALAATICAVCGLLFGLQGDCIAAELNTPEDVAAFCTKAYDTVDSLKVLVSATYTMVQPNSGSNATATAQIEFKRPGLFRVDGTNRDGLTYAGVADGTNSAYLDGLGWHKESDSEGALFMVSAWNLGCSDAIAHLTMHSHFEMPFQQGKFGSNVGTEVIGGRKSYRIAYTVFQATTIYWIDMKSGLIAKEKYDRGIGTEFHETTIRTYNYQSVNGKIADSVFTMPK